MSEWRPANEPPRTLGIYLVAQANEVRLKEFIQGQWYDLDDTNYCPHPVTHWMPLPDPPNTTDDS